MKYLLWFVLSCGPGYTSVQCGLYCLGLNHPKLEIKMHVWPIIEFLLVPSDTHPAHA